MTIFDLAVIGGGIGGYSAAIRAAELGLKVALIEKNKIGGTCLNVGCIPSKILVKKASLLKKAQKMGLSGQLNLSEIVKDKCSTVQKLSTGLTMLLKSRQITLIHGEAAFLSKSELQIGDQTIEAKKILIATGSAPLDFKTIPADHKTIFNSNSILNLETQPKSLAIIGGGYIGCELAFFFNAIGTHVFLIEAEDHLLPFVDKEIAAAYQKSLQKQGIEVLTSAFVEKSEKDEKGVKLFLKDNNQPIEAEKALVAIGRKIETYQLQLDKIPLALNPNGSITVNAQMETATPNIYAVGDITDKVQLAHLALHQGIVAAHNIAGEKKEMLYNAVPSVIFTSPELSCVGYTLQEALDKGLKAQTAIFPLAALGIAIALKETEGMVKLVFEEKSQKILGAQILGDGSSNLISEITLAITAELSLDDLAKTIHPHPTLSEAIFETALIGKEMPLHMFKAKKL